jgi:ABC-type lipoprotein export system ATPase subunit
MQDSLFSIKDLSCSYDKNAGNKVLHIQELEIPKGRLVFLLGASGCGKSTLLETLGLMNNTIASGNISLSPNGSTTRLDIPSLWNKGNFSKLTGVRKDYYSFIFQNTNLMENFTAYENVCLSGMIKENLHQKEVLPRAKELMEKIKLPQSEVGLQTLAVNLSGGQRQRLAFVRALNNKATVLFGDEPTGNLDEANAHELFGIIKSNLKGGLSAIVVSHDINLAVKFADQIIVITKDSGKGYGEVLKQNIFDRSSWENYNELELLQFKERLRSYYDAGNEQKLAKEKEETETDTGLGYRKLFLRKEGKILFGKGMVNLWVLSMILFFTFLAIGFANGSLDYLHKKMNSAFVNWVSISIPFIRSDHGEVNKILSQLQSPELKKKFLYESVTPYVRSSFSVWDGRRNDFIPVKSRSIDFNNDAKLFRQFVLDEKNLIYGKDGFRHAMDIGVIVRAEFLKAFNYPADATVIYFEQLVKDTVADTNVRLRVPIPVRAVVTELPGKYDLIYPMYFFQAFNSSAFNSTFNLNNKTSDIQFFVQTNDKEKAASINKSIMQMLEKDAAYSTHGPMADPVRPDTLGFKPGYTIKINLYPALATGGAMDSLSTQLLAEGKKQFGETEIVRTYNYDDIAEELKQPTYDEISVYFKDLDRIRDFSEYLFATFNKKEDSDQIELDVTKVKEKENFNFLSKVTGIISWLLVVFSTLAVGLFIFNILKSHLNKVKMNIGTFKAIGLADGEARNIYVMIIFAFIAIATALSLLAASGCGYLLNSILTQNLKVEQDVNYFKILDPNTLFALGIILLSSFAISWLTIRRILSKTPGDLIYNR